MEWVTLVVWVVVLLVAGPLLLAATSAAAFLLPGAAAVGGVALTVLWIVLDDGDWTAWAAIGVALLGCATVGAGAYVLMSEDRSAAGSTLDEVMAMIAGVALPMFAVAGSMSLLLATIA